MEFAREQIQSEIFKQSERDRAHTPREEPSKEMVLGSYEVSECGNNRLPSELQEVSCHEDEAREQDEFPMPELHSRPLTARRAHEVYEATYMKSTVQ